MPEAEPSLPRRTPKSAYRNSNGFLDNTRARTQGTVQVPNIHVAAKAVVPKFDAMTGLDPAMAPERHALRDAVERRQIAEDMLQLKGEYFPGLEAAKDMNSRRETSTTVTERIEELQQQHYASLRTLYAWQADDYLDDALDKYLSSDKAGARGLDMHYQVARVQNTSMLASFDNVISAHQYAHLNTVLPLMKQRTQLALEEKQQQRRRDAQFPANVTEFRAIANKDIQMRIARFLVADAAGRESLMAQYQWAFRQTKPLIDEYILNVEFQAEIKQHIREYEARDPRRNS